MFRKMCPRSTWHVMRIHVENVDSTHICAYLRKSGYVCYLLYLPSPIPTPPNPSAPPHPPTRDIPPGAGVGGWGMGVGMGLGGRGGSRHSKTYVNVRKSS